MALDKNDWKQLDKRFGKIERRFEKQQKGIISAVNRLLIAQDIRNFGKMDELEVKFEKKLDEFKSDFFDKIDPVLKEVTTEREERLLIESRIKALENIHPNRKHATAS